MSALTAYGKPVMDQGDGHGGDVTEVFRFGAVQNEKGRCAIGLNSYVSKLVQQDPQSQEDRVGTFLLSLLERTGCRM